MKPYRFREDAYLDFAEIVAQLRTQSPSAASRFTFKVDQRLRLLASFPDLGLPRPDIGRHPYKYFPIAPYLVAYDPETKPLEIVGFKHSARELKPFPRS